MNPRARILHIMQCANLGGMERTTVCRIRGLIDHGQICRLVSLNPIGGLGDVLQRVCIPSTGLQYRGFAGTRSIPAMHREFRREPCDAVMMTGHNLAAMIALGDLGKGHRILCIHFHHAVVLRPINIHIQSKNKKMLVIDRLHMRTNKSSK